MSPDDGLSVVVLGASGFVGRAVCEAFAARGARVLGVSRHPVHDPSPTPPVRFERFCLTRAPVGELTALLRTHSAHVVVNAAGAVWGVTAAQLRESNVELTHRLLAALSSMGRRHRPRLIHLGSAQEYGPGVPGRSVGEDAPPGPVSAYGRSKLLATEAVLRSAEEGHVDGIVLRVANAFGPHSPPNSLLGLIADHLAAAARGTGAPPAPLQLSPLRAQLDFVDVRDVAHAVTGAAHMLPGERLINIGRGEAVSVRGLVNRLIALSDLDVLVIEKDMAPSGRAGVEWQRLDITRARSLLDWRPRRGLQESLHDLLEAAGGTPASSPGAHDDLPRPTTSPATAVERTTTP